MPWPTNSRTTENPNASTCRCTAWPMSETRAPGPHALDRLVERLFGHPQQPRRFLRHRPDRQRDRAVAEIPVERRADVDRNDVAFVQHPAARRNPVDHLVVDRRADRRRIPVITLERRRRPRGENPLLRQRIEVRRRRPGRDVRRQLRQHVADQTAGFAHPLQLGGRAADDHGRPLSPSRCRAESIAVDQIRRDAIGRLRAVHRPERRPRLVVLHQRLRLAVVHLQALAHDRVVIVAALHQPAAARAGMRRAWPLAPCARVRRTPRRPCASSRRRTSSASGTTMSTTISGSRSVHDLVERRRLRDRPRKPVEHEPVACVALVEPFAHDPDHHVVAHQLAARHRSRWRAGRSPSRCAPLRAGCRRSRSSGSRAPGRTAPPGCPLPAPGGPSMIRFRAMRV